MSDVMLRLKCRVGTFSMTVPLNLSMSDLREQVSALSDIPVASIKLLLGFPPKPIEDFERSVEDAGLKSGDTIIAESNPSGASASVQPVHSETSTSVLKHVSDPIVGDDMPLILRKVVPADNSCLFTSLGFVLGGIDKESNNINNSKINLDCGNYMRKIISNSVKDNQEEFSEAVLGKPNKDYCDWIMNPDSWGGAIEVSILSNFYGMEIAVIDTQSGSICKFGEDKNFPHRVFLIYDGIHYDPLYVESPFAPGVTQTLFPTNDDRMLDAAYMLANEAKSSRQYTDVNRFSLKCLECGVIMIGQTQAQEHAKLTAHTNFNEY